MRLGFQGKPLAGCWGGNFLPSPSTCPPVGACGTAPPLQGSGPGMTLVWCAGCVPLVHGLLLPASIVSVGTWRDSVAASAGMAACGSRPVSIIPCPFACDHGKFAIEVMQFTSFEALVPEHAAALSGQG